MYNPAVRVTTRTTALCALACAAAACASSGPVSWEQVRPPEAYLETLPAGALVTVNGAEVGRGPLSFPVPDADRRYAVRVTAPGFEPATLEETGARLAGARLDVVLRPEGFGSQRPLATGEPAGLAQAAAVLLRANRPADALAFAKASIAAGESAQAHRVAGEACRRLGDRNQAIRELSLYVTQAPDAPDRKAVEQAIAAMRHDIDMTPAKAQGN